MIEHVDKRHAIIGHARKNQEQDMSTLGMAFMGFLMGVGAICGIWFLSGLLEVFAKMMG